MNTTLEDALQFVRNSDKNSWDVLIREMNATRKRRDLEAAMSLTVGNMALFETSDPKNNRKGRIISIARGRAVLSVLSEQSGFLERISVPASMVRHSP